MTELRQCMIEDMQLRTLPLATQRNYIHYVADFAKYFGMSPDKLGLEAVREYQLYLLNERKLSPESINTFVTAVKFLERDYFVEESFVTVTVAGVLSVFVSDLPSDLLSGLVSDLVSDLAAASPPGLRAGFVPEPLA